MTRLQICLPTDGGRTNFQCKVKDKHSFVLVDGRECLRPVLSHKSLIFFPEPEGDGAVPRYQAVSIMPEPHVRLLGGFSAAHERSMYVSNAAFDLPWMPRGIITRDGSASLVMHDLSAGCAVLDPIGFSLRGVYSLE